MKKKGSEVSKDEFSSMFNHNDSSALDTSIEGTADEVLSVSGKAIKKAYVYNLKKKQEYCSIPRKKLDKVKVEKLIQEGKNIAMKINQEATKKEMRRHQAKDNDDHRRKSLLVHHSVTTANISVKENRCGWSNYLLTLL